MGVYSGKSDEGLIAVVLARYAGARVLSRTDRGVCVYGHMINGVGCAIGCLLPAGEAERWDGLMAYADIRDIQERYHEAYAGYFADEQLGLLEALQSTHDRCRTVRTFVKRLRTMRADTPRKGAEHDDA